MNLLDQRIRTFASQGLSPYEIEERLGMEHYTIHIKYHQALMNGYTMAPASGQAHALSAEEKAERKRERAKERREEKKAEAKKQGEVPKRVEMTHESGLPEGESTTPDTEGSTARNTTASAGNSTTL